MKTITLNLKSCLDCPYCQILEKLREEENGFYCTIKHPHRRISAEDDEISFPDWCDIK